ncbi:RcpC/CpaB family pilus assembly protein [Actinomarinicola tropica]|uniref:SAF domain-containing protein n=1 Tax=Actinomarinicola tropica TaxID=2789776 RepID=A0A5Q2RFP6_9ACTN|nr:RcpC/CpaB family pilus assembly protein [Actinomarinicola tropica]QGG95648.1 hypothetical protein GH723_11385 [Actinomarinicola tropica]
MITEQDRRTPLDVEEPAPRRAHGRPRRPLPSSRAVVGGLLVASAALGSVVIATSGSGPATVPVLVADGTVEPGTALGPSSLRVVEMALPAELLDSTFDDPDELRGTVSRSRLADGELLQDGDVVASTPEQRAAAPAREVSLRLDAHRVVAGRVEPGDTVDVLATYGNGADATTTLVLGDAHVIAVESSDDRIAGSRTVILTLALDERADTVALAHALDVASINVVRTTTASPGDAVEPYTLGDAPEAQDS